MIQDNAIIHGRAVGEWKKLAQDHDQPNGTPEELGAFIEKYLKADHADYFHPLRMAARKAELEAEEREFLEMLKELKEYKPSNMTAQHLTVFETELESLEHSAEQLLKVLHADVDALVKSYAEKQKQAKQ